MPVRRYIAEAVVVLMRFAFEQLQLHRLEICIVPRNANSRRVVEKLDVRCEGLAERYLEINGVWEDHLRFAITARGVAGARRRAHRPLARNLRPERYRTSSGAFGYRTRVAN